AAAPVSPSLAYFGSGSLLLLHAARVAPAARARATSVRFGFGIVMGGKGRRVWERGRRSAPSPRAGRRAADRVATTSGWTGSSGRGRGAPAPSGSPSRSAP